MLKVAVIVAMAEELESLIDVTSAKHFPTIKTLDCYSSQLGQTEVVFVRSKIGKVNAAAAATLAAELLHPACIINAGSLAALDTKLPIGSLILGKSCTYHDVDLSAVKYPHGQLPEMPACYEASRELLGLCEREAHAHPIPYATGMIVTGDQFVSNLPALTRIKNLFPGALGLDMETTAVAQVAHLFQIPFVSVRCITDHANGEASTDFEAHLAASAKVIAKFMSGVLPQIAKHTPTCA